MVHSPAYFQESQKTAEAIIDVVARGLDGEDHWDLAEVWEVPPHAVEHESKATMKAMQGVPVVIGTGSWSGAAILALLIMR